jgi:hypothetical protein
MRVGFFLTADLSGQGARFPRRYCDVRAALGPLPLVRYYSILFDRPGFAMKHAQLAGGLVTVMRNISWAACCWAGVFAAAASMLAGCASNSAKLSSQSSVQTGPATTVAALSATTAQAPIALTAALPAAAPVEMSIADGLITPAINLHRFNAKLPAGTALKAGADLNGDGVPEAVVLMTEPVCLAQGGCPLVVFQQTGAGYRAISQTAHVLPPIGSTAEVSQGWRDLVVSDAGGQRRRLAFTASGYPADSQSGIELAANAPAEILISSTDPSVASPEQWSTRVNNAAQPNAQQVASFMVPLGADKEEGKAGQ